MKVCIFLILNSIVLSSGGFAQAPSKQLPFILLIDNDIPVNNIYDGFFSAVDSEGIIKYRIPFEYRVGSLVISSSDYTRLFSIDAKSNVLIDFKYTKVGRDSSEGYEYKKEIPAKWLNEKYMIFKIYNYTNKESRAKYVLRKGKYGIEISVPGAGSVIPKKSL
jgi:hypothetical protein